MYNIISTIDETYVKLNKFIDSIQVVGDEFKGQLAESENKLKRLIQINELQNKIGKYFVKKNNLNLMNRNQIFNNFKEK